MNVCMSVLSFFLGPVCFFLDSALLYSNLEDIEKLLVLIVIYLYLKPGLHDNFFGTVPV